MIRCAARHDGDRARNVRSTARSGASSAAKARPCSRKEPCKSRRARRLSVIDSLPLGKPLQLPGKAGTFPGKTAQPPGSILQLPGSRALLSDSGVRPRQIRARLQESRGRPPETKPRQRLRGHLPLGSATGPPQCGRRLPRRMARPAAFLRVVSGSVARPQVRRWAVLRSALASSPTAAQRADPLSSPAAPERDTRRRQPRPAVSSSRRTLRGLSASPRTTTHAIAG